MALPTTRNTTYTAGSSPIKANDINALQDCMVAAVSLKELNLHSTLWAPINFASSTPPTYTNGLWGHPGSGGFRFVLPLILPVGSLVKEMTFGYFRGTGTMEVDVIRYSIAANASTLRILFTDADGAAFETRTITSAGTGLAIGGGLGDLVIESGYAYALDAAITGGTTGQLGSMQLKYVPPTI